MVSALERVGVRDHFRAVVTADDVERRKPSPDIYLEAVRRLRRASAIDRHRGLGPGVAAARAAGMKAVAIPHWLTESHDLSGADLRVSHAGELTLAALESLYAGRLMTRFVSRSRGLKVLAV